MKILDDLKREKAEKQSGIARHGDAAAPSVAPSEPALRAIEALHAGLAEFAEGLNQLEADVRVAYEVEPMGTLKGLVQKTYSVVNEDATRARFVFSFQCVGQDGLHRLVDTIAARDQIQAELDAFGIPYTVNDLSTIRYAIDLKPVVAVSLAFAPTADGSGIRMEARNFHRLGVERFTMQPSHVSAELINELGKMILRRENRFAEMIGNIVSQEMRKKLRARVKSRERSRAKIAEDIQKDLAAGQGGLKKLLRGGEEPSLPAPAARRAPRQAPVMVAEIGRAEGWVNWDSARSAPASGRCAGDATLPGSPAAPGGEPAGTDQARYAWMITHDVQCIDTAGSIARRGPAGSAPSFPIPKILKTGESFRMKGKNDELRYSGMIAGEYQGVEPLVDFGIKNGCYVIEYNRDGKWVQVRADD